MKSVKLEMTETVTPTHDVGETKTESDFTATALAQITELASPANGKTERIASLLVDLSHELRTPLNGILASGDLLLRSTLDEDQRNKVRLIQQSARSLLLMAENVLDLAQIDGGKIQLTDEPLKLPELLEEIVQILKPAADEKGLRLYLRIAENLPGDMQGDPGRIRQILTNLTDNAIKYTNTGEVILLVETGRLTETRATLVFSVRDTGIGIPASRMASMFERFERNPISQPSSQQGAGLGLAISRELAQRMRGNLSVYSVPGYGSEFRLTLPLKRVSPPLVLSEATEETQATKTVSPEIVLTDAEPEVLLSKPAPLAIVIDDDGVSRESLSERLQRNGWRAITATNWMEAKPLLGEETPAVFLLDYRLENGTALETAQAIRENDSRLSRVPFVVVSAHRAGELSELTANGEFFEVLEKPVADSVFLSLLARLEALQKPEPIADNPSVPEAPELPANETANDIAELPALNMAVLLPKVANNRGVLAMLARIFLSEAPPVLAEMREAIEARQWETLPNFAHKLRGMTMGVSAETTTQRLRSLETVLQDGETERVNFQFGLLTREFDRLRAELEVLASTESE